MNEPYYRYWGKAKKDQPDYHLLVYHSLDVAAVADVWWSESLTIRRSFVETTGLDETQTRAWMLFFVALHDLGKFDVRFQMKAPNAALSLWQGFGKSKKEKKYDHGESGYAWFREECETSYGLGYDQAEAFDLWMKAVTGHHGRLSLAPEIIPPNASPEVISHDREARKAWINKLWELFLKSVGILPDSIPPAYPSLMSGFCSVCDWLGSNEDTGYFKYEKEQTDLSEYFEQRKVIAKKSLIDMGLLKIPVKSGGMNILFPDRVPHQIQTLVDEFPLESGLTIIEAPTGSGKTEAALAYASRMLAKGLADSIIFALPTQATANAMLERIEKMADKLFPEGSNVVLAHGKAKYNPRFVDLKKASERETAQEKEEALVQCVKWLSYSRKRVFLGQIGVCTIDQVLLSVLPIKHHFVRAFGIRKSILIVDEVHAYDAYMYGLLNAVLKGQRQAGASAILLSATLPLYQREQLLRDWKAEVPISENDPYPLMTHAGLSGKVQPFWKLAQNQLPKERKVEIALCPSSEMLPSAELLEEIRIAAESGAKVAIVCNLVADAQKLASELNLETKIPIDVFHARFRFKDRQKRENEVLKLYGEKRTDGDGRILVATQVVEQSLDLDFDWLITQLCPVDLLFQRLGRLHRHKRYRPKGFESPKCSLLIPSDADYGLHKLIYGNLRALWRTEQLLRQHSTIEFPKAYREWIEKVYRQEAWDGEPEEIIRESEQFDKEQYGKRYGALQRANSDAMPFSDTDGNAAMLTRDGETNLNVLLILENDLTLEGDPFSDSDDWRYEEQLNQNTVSVPSSWKKLLPPSNENGLHSLTMRAMKSGEWESINTDVIFRYTEYKGLERVET